MSEVEQLIRKERDIEDKYGQRICDYAWKLANKKYRELYGNENLACYYAHPTLTDDNIIWYSCRKRALYLVYYFENDIVLHPRMFEEILELYSQDKLLG